jgi:large subunit ribosomal protein L27
MAHRKAAGTAKNLRDSQPKYLGLKKGSGESVIAGNIILRQRGTKFLAGKNVGLGKDHTIFALKPGKVSITQKRQTKFDNTIKMKKVINVI